MRIIMAVVLACTSVAAQSVPGGVTGSAQYNGGASLAGVSTVLYVSAFSGSDFGARANACFAALPATGGTCDASGITGGQTTAATIAIPANVGLKLDPGVRIYGSAGANPVVSFANGSVIWSDIQQIYNVNSKGATLITLTASNEVIAPSARGTQTNSVTISRISLLSTATSGNAALLDLTNTSYATVQFCSFSHPALSRNTGSAIFTKSITPYANEYSHFIDNDFNVPGGRAYDLEDNTYVFTVIGGQVRAASDCLYMNAISTYGIDGGDILGLKCINNTGYAWNVGQYVGHVHWIGGRMESNVSAGLVNVSSPTGNVDLTLMGISILDIQNYGTDQGVVNWPDYDNGFAYPQARFAGSLQVARTIDLSTTTSLTAGVLRINRNAFLHNYGTANTWVGTNAGNFSLTGTDNTCVGTQCLMALTSGSSNSGLGWSSLAANTTGQGNTAMGAGALGGVTTGSGNTALGFYAGVTGTGANQDTTGRQNTWVGFCAGPSASAQLTNSTAIGNAAQNSASNQVVLGNSSVRDVYMGSASASAVEHSAGYIGPVSAPTGPCSTNGEWVLSRDGHATFCSSGRWVRKI
jgi:hypothetical protein